MEDKLRKKIQENKDKIINNHYTKFCIDNEQDLKETFNKFLKIGNNLSNTYNKLHKTENKLYKDEFNGSKEFKGFEFQDDFSIIEYDDFLHVAYLSSKIGYSSLTFF